jgi:long-chain fatty acid transport protein
MKEDQMKKMKRYGADAFGWLAMAAMALFCGSVWADGLRNPPEGAGALGRAGVRLTTAEDATTVTHNPANLMDIQTEEVTPTVTLGYSKKDYTSASGEKTSTDDTWSVLPATYVAWPIADGNYVLGLGMNMPYGQATHWDRDGIFRYTAPYETEMKTVNFNPSVATKIGKHLYVGAGVDVMWSSLSMKQAYSLANLTSGAIASDADLKFYGTGYGVGANAGVTWLITDRQRLALVYRSPITVQYEGDFDIEMDSATAAAASSSAALQSLATTSDFETEIEFPATAAAGYGIQLGEHLRLEADVEWVQHSSYDTQTLDVGANNSLLQTTLGSNTIKYDWNDTWTFGLGADWQFDEHWTARTGWTYLPSPVPDDTLTPYLAEGDANVFAVGLGYSRGAHKLDVAYAYNLMESREISGNQSPYYNGTYDFNAHLASVSYSFSF